jgi:flagellar basal body-associated protein FliL
MAEENDEQTLDGDDGEGQASGGGSGKIVIIIGAINTLAIIGLAAFVMMGGGGGGGGPPTMMSPEQMAEDALAKEVPVGVPSVKGAPGPKVEIGELIVNLKEPTGDRYLKTKIELELDNEETRAEVEGRLAAIRYQLNLLLSGQRVADVQGPEAIETLRKSMIRRANAVLSRGRIVNVWPAEWIVQ